ncbi:Zinc finger, RING/FYVE/PHD-type [Cinara cedri]|uniref:Zinc finger, RING/FYVE/PHD-type n=1 Tax=Cinara cedri TaxID=506608 RepID=A0A5E4MY54_9HEMI|nr:Zinc finger, RING/FYVE/PHD-type [Cinara cedri]
MLCTVCNDDIYDNEEIKCAKCKTFLYFTCAGFRESNFRKMSSINKGKLCCSNCKNTSMSISDTHNEKEIILEKDSRKILLDLKNSVDFMSKQFDDFSTQLRDITKSVKVISGENKFLNKRKKTGKILETISKVLGGTTSVEHVYRTRSKVQNKPGKIVAVLHSNNNKKTLMDLARKKKLKAKDINTEWSNEENDGHKNNIDVIVLTETWHDV